MSIQIDVADGRRRRSARSRERILDALARVICEPGAALSPERVAARAGVSVSTIFRHFGDTDGLAAAMRERIARAVAPHLAGAPFEGDLGTRVRELVRRRSAIYEIVAPFERLAARQTREPRGARGRRERFRAALRAQLDAALGPELRGDPEATEIAGVLLSLGAWTHLRVERRLGVAEAAALVERAVLRQVAGRVVPARRRHRAAGDPAPRP